jgi:hypothetical protein
MIVPARTYEMNNGNAMNTLGKSSAFWDNEPNWHYYSTGNPSHTGGPVQNQTQPASDLTSLCCFSNHPDSLSRIFKWPIFINLRQVTFSISLLYIEIIVTVLASESITSSSLILVLVNSKSIISSNADALLLANLD